MPTATLSTPSDFRISLETLRFRYEPFPIGIAAPVLPAGAYQGLCDTWPSQELFVFKKNLGHKYSLSEVNNPDAYHEFLRSHHDWRHLYESVKGPRFIYNVLDALCSHQIDLGLQKRHVSVTHRFSSTWDLARAAIKKVARAAMRRSESPLTARFEFSMLPAAGGNIKPHTDAPQKLITLVLSMVREGEWDDSWGGGTQVLRPKDTTRNFNFLNKQFEFDDCEAIDAFPFHPNQCVLFVKTFNSFHSVSPMTGPDDGTMRRTLTINIETWG